LRSLLALSIMLVCASSTLYAQTVLWDPNTETDIAGYKVYKGTQSGVYGTPIDVGKTTTYQPQGVDWTKKAYFAVQAYNTSGMTSPLSAEAVWTPASINIVSAPITLTANVDFPTPPANQVTWTAILGSPVFQPVEYKFLLTNVNTNTTTLLRDYSSSNQVQTTLAAGKYVVQAMERQ